MYKLQDLSIKDQAYYIIITLNGSWLYNALYPQIDDEVFCKSIVDNFLSDHGYGDCDGLGITQMINECYPDLLIHRALKVV